MVIALSPFLFFRPGDAALSAGFPPAVFLAHVPRPSAFGRHLSRFGRSPGSRVLARLAFPGDIPSGSSASLAAYSCGGSAAFSPASLLARDASRGAPKHLYLGCRRPLLSIYGFRRAK